MSIYEYNEEEHMRMEREQHFEDGVRCGEIRGVVKTCREFDLSDEEIVAKIIEKYLLDEETARSYCK